jgi:dihydroorotate dehydrogenase
MLWKIFRKFLFVFSAERIHEVSCFFLRVLGRRAPIVLEIVSGAGTRQLDLRKTSDVFKVAGVDFWGPVGLAAGFDKDGKLLSALPHLGFHFVEVGTVTPRAQPGNDKPRLFRIPQDDALFNRMGFNNQGGDQLKKRLQDFAFRKPWNFRVGVNLGKNKDTPPEMAVNDYVLLAESLAEHADYLVVNVSSPNTPGLRDLQNLPQLETLIRAVRGAVIRSGFERPLFLKLAPELSADFIQEIAQKLRGWGGSGLVLTNTLGFEHAGQRGGLSGRPLQERSRWALKTVRDCSDIPVISVGGIDSEDEALERLRLGANLIQIYSAWIFKGPRFPSRLANYLRSKV